MPALSHHVDVGVAKQNEAFLQLLKVQFFALDKADRLNLAEPILDGVNQRTSRGDDNSQRRLRGARFLRLLKQLEPTQHPHTLGHRLHARREPLVRKRLPCWEHFYDIAQHVPEHGSDVLCLTTGGRDHQHRRVLRHRSRDEWPHAF